MRSQKPIDSHKALVAELKALDKFHEKMACAENWVHATAGWRQDCQVNCAYVKKKLDDFFRAHPEMVKEERDKWPADVNLKCLKRLKACAEQWELTIPLECRRKELE